jgi:polyferredoxin
VVLALVVSPAQWAAVAAFVFLAILASSQLGAIWRGEQRRQWPTWWARSLPAWIAVAWLMIFALPVELFVMSRPEPVSRWLVFTLGAVLLIVVGAMIVAAAVTLIGHPRRAVPPYLRGGDAKN